MNKELIKDAFGKATEKVLNENVDEGKEGKCILCSGPYTQYGHNPYPLSEIGRACDMCNGDVVQERIRQIQTLTPKSE